MKINQFLKIVFIAVCLQFMGVQANAKDIEVRNGNIVLDFSTKISAQVSAGKYTIKRATGKFSEYKTIGTSSTTLFQTSNAEVSSPGSLVSTVFSAL